ncbi:TetR/AcrR family transcriptional regulator [Actinomycetospora endophytica]|uniref:TetR/AcrR family transcriptional regulator n=1 Tax=Actinomycetospora endophytica TaxID=2291215 RepID=A0ABS8PB02_9PSEU|nr:TetR/AcrR family transcriptional regulator [Actinomycetospora endophytica]MCD2195319.1 TetR/AcrR family transcriptional regulator [Actinomycetospora endophytica]
METEHGDWRTYDDVVLSPVLTAALDAFVEFGYHGTTVRIIAARASMSVPGLYYHYPGKQEMLAALLARSLDELLGRSTAAAHDADDDPVAQFRVQVENAVLFMTHCQKLRLLASRDVISLDEPARSAHVARRDELQEHVTIPLARGQREGCFTVDDPAAAARAVLDMCRGVADWYRPDGPESPERIAERYTAYALALVGRTLASDR